MLSLTSEYALRAMIYLTRHEEDWPIPGWQIADGTNVPPKYLSKILGDLVRFGVLASSPGKRGGFRLIESANKTKIFEILEPFENFERKHCPFGNEDCSDESRCGAHKKWKRVIEAEQSFLRQTSLCEISRELKSPSSKKRTKGLAKGRNKNET